MKSQGLILFVCLFVCLFVLGVCLFVCLFVLGDIKEEDSSSSLPLSLPSPGPMDKVYRNH